MENNNLHHRHSIRLPEYDYSEPGEYFITIITKGRQCLFGEVIDGNVHLNPLGEIVRSEWLKTPSIRQEIELGEFIIMPNHFHAIVHIIITDQTVGATGRSPLQPMEFFIDNEPNAEKKRPQLAHGPSPKSLGSLVAGYKSSVTKRINEFRGTPGVAVWQRNYYEHIIASDREYEKIDAYIANNPANWLIDTEYSKILDNLRGQGK